MPVDEESLKRDFFRALADKPLEPGDAWYEPIHEQGLSGSDPVELLARGIEWTASSGVQLLSGFRGTGKSTELRRLRKRLVDGGYLVVLCDIEDYLDLHSPVDVPDFLIALAGAFGEGMKALELLGEDATAEGYWTRFVGFLRQTQVALEGVEISGGADVVGAGVKVGLRRDPSFRQSLQEKLAGHLGALVNDVHGFMEECVKALKDKHGAEREVVLILDSVEHIRGTSINADAVHASVETLFAGHADKLQLPFVHAVYTVPPYLKIRAPGVGNLYSPGGLLTLPAIKVRERNGQTNDDAVEAVVSIVANRCADWQTVLGDRAVLEKLILSSGGHLRDLFRILMEVLRRARTLPVDDALVDEAVNQIRSEFLPIPDADALWLSRVAETHRAGLEDRQHLPTLAGYLDTHLVLCYRNGEEWFDVHPLVRDRVREQPDEVEQRKTGRDEPDPSVDPADAAD